jgi:hypothetical protein
MAPTRFTVGSSSNDPGPLHAVATSAATTTATNDVIPTFPFLMAAFSFAFALDGAARVAKRKLAFADELARPLSSDVIPHLKLAAPKQLRDESRRQRYQPAKSDQGGSVHVCALTNAVAPESRHSFAR